MGKTKYKSYRQEDKKFSDGYGIKDKKKTYVNKSKEKRFDRAIKSNNIDEILNLEDKE